MKITDELIDYVSVLSRIEITDEKREQTKDDLEKLINYMDVLNGLDTENIEAMSHAFPVKNVFREDVLGESIDRDIITENAPHKKDGCFKVPKTVE